MNATLEQIAGHLEGAARVLLIAHVNPDADALGSTLATAIALESRGKSVQVTFPDEPFDVPLSLRFLPRQDLITDPADLGPANVVVAMDASSGDRLGRLLARAQAAPVFVAVDHHASFEPFAHINLVDAAQPATGLMALELIDLMGIDLTDDMAVCLYSAISSDTGSFRFASTTPESMRVAARLLEVGIDFASAAKAMFDSKSLDFLALQAQAMSALELREVGDVKVALVRVSRADREQHEIAFTQVESLIDAVRTVEGAEVAVVLKEDDAGAWRVSSRSIGAVDVGQACTMCGGGGHRMAGGFTGGPDPERTLADFLAAIS